LDQVRLKRTSCTVNKLTPARIKINENQRRAEKGFRLRTQTPASVRAVERIDTVTNKPGTPKRRRDL
jgi:hypothetical protein